MLRMINRVVMTESAKKDLKRAPLHIVEKLNAWAYAVERVGLDEIRKIRGYYDHALAGNRAGQRSISLNKQWRAIYTLEKDTAKLVFVAVHEVTPHKY